METEDAELEHELAHISFFFSSRRRHTRLQGDWSSDVCSSDLNRRTQCFCLSREHSHPPSWRSQTARSLLATRSVRKAPRLVKSFSTRQSPATRKSSPTPATASRS